MARYRLNVTGVARQHAGAQGEKSYRAVVDTLPTARQVRAARSNDATVSFA